MSLARNIKDLREGRGMSQDQLARQLGISYPRISEIERNQGNPTLKTLEKIADFFGVSVPNLLEDKKVTNF